MNPDEYQRKHYNDDGPYIESTITPSKNGRLLIHRTTITHVKPANYYEAILRTAKQRRDDNKTQAPDEVLV